VGIGVSWPPGTGEIMIAVLPLGSKSKEAFHAFVVKDTEELNARMKGRA
jgi:hypothetical protein